MAERLDCVVVTTTAGKGIVSEGHPLSLGATLPFRPVQDLLKEADIILGVGTEMSETDTLYTYTLYEIGGDRSVLGCLRADPTTRADR